jgi:hypothetical protein
MVPKQEAKIAVPARYDLVEEKAVSELALNFRLRL